MAKCDRCSKATTFGHNRSFSQRATSRTFRPNLQKGNPAWKTGGWSAKPFVRICIRTLAKTV